MIDTLLNRIGGLLEKRFLFSAFIPVLFFIGGNLLLAAATIGLQDCFRWFAALNVSLQGLLSAAFFVIVIMTAYLVSSLRGPILKLWSKLYLPVLDKLLARWHGERYRRLRRESFDSNPWDGLDERLALSVDKQWDDQDRSPLDEHGETTCRNILRDLNLDKSPGGFEKKLTDIVKVFSVYNGEQLTGFYEEVRRYLIDCREQYQYKIQRDIRQLDRSYGSSGTILPTTLGNIVAAYNQYPYTRYKIEGEFLWPRLMQVTPETFNETIQDKKAFLDFALAMATGFLISAFSILIYGPMLRMDEATLVAWPLISASMLIAMYLSYRSAIMAARDFGDILRAACDLFRLDLMKALQRPHPADLQEEREQWIELSQLMAYGTVQNFLIRPESTLSNEKGDL